MRTYWAFVWHEANRAAWKWVVGHVGAAMISVGTVAAGLVGLWTLGSADGFRDQIIVLAAALLAMLMTYTGILAVQLLALPPRLHAEQDSEIRRVRAMSLSPLKYVENPIDQREVTWVHGNGPSAHVVLFNQLTDRSVHNVEVQLVRITRVNAEGEALPVQLSLDDLPVKLMSRDGVQKSEIAPQSEHAFKLCYVHWKMDVGHADMPMYPSAMSVAPGRSAELSIPAGRYRFETVAAGLDIPPARRTFILDASNTTFSFRMETVA